MRTVRVTVTVERVDWQDSVGQPLTVSSVTRQAMKAHDGLLVGAPARRALGAMVRRAAEDAIDAACDADLWKEDDLTS